MDAVVAQGRLKPNAAGSTRRDALPQANEARSPQTSLLESLWRRRMLFGAVFASTLALTAARRRHDSTSAVVTQIRKQVEAAKAQAADARADEISIEALVRAAEIKRRKYSELHGRASELETERRVLRGNARLASLAEIPDQPFFPKRAPFAAASVTLATLLAGAAATGLFLSLYRIAWISMLAAMLFRLAFKSTRGRTTPLVIGILVATIGAVTLTPFGDVIADRLSTLMEGGQDGSARERVEEFVTLWCQPDGSLWGVRFSTVDVGAAGVMAVDGVVVACWLSMRIVVGLICLFSLGWTLVEGFSTTLCDPRGTRALLGAFSVFSRTQLPLAAIVAGELGLLFWVFAALAMQKPALAPGRLR